MTGCMILSTGMEMKVPMNTIWPSSGLEKTGLYQSCQKIVMLKKTVSYSWIFGSSHTYFELWLGSPP